MLKKHTVYLNQLLAQIHQKAEYSGNEGCADRFCPTTGQKPAVAQHGICCRIEPKAKSVFVFFFKFEVESIQKRKIATECLGFDVEIQHQNLQL